MVLAQWVLEEPLFGNPLIALGGGLVNTGLQERFVGAGICKLAHLRSPEGRGWRTPGLVAEKLGLHSVRNVEKLMGKMVGAVPLSTGAAGQPNTSSWWGGFDLPRAGGVSGNGWVAGEKGIYSCFTRNKPGTV